MVDPQGFRTNETEGQEGRDEEMARPDKEDLSMSARKNTKRKVRDACESGNPGQSLASEELGGKPKGDGVRAQNERRKFRQNQDLPLSQEDLRAQFYEHYHKEAEGYDKEFMKKYDEDLNTSLIFAGLFSAVASAFIIQVQPDLKPDPNEETAALLRVLIYKTDNTTFGGNVPATPQWSGPPPTIVHVQAILYTSLAASLFSAFLAMLGKQWLNRYASTNVRGSAIERSQNRQRKLNGIMAWYFDCVMESLPVMLQAALLLLGAALSLYLWEINVAVASVVLGTTAFGAVFYLFILIAGSIFVGCPYQTPESRIIRSAALLAASAVSTISSTIGRGLACSETIEMFWLNVQCHQPWWSRNNIRPFIKDIIHELLPSLSTDACRLGRVILRLLVTSVHLARTPSPGVPPTPPRPSDQQTILLDLHCVSWMLHISLDKDDHLSTLQYLATVVPPASFDPTLVVDCFDILVDCTRVVDSCVVITDRPAHLEIVSAVSLLHTFSHLSAADRMSTALTDVRQRYQRAFPPKVLHNGHPLYHILGAIYSALYPDRNHRWFHWEGHKPTAYEHIVVARALSRLSWSEYQREERRKVPRWILRFALHSLSQDPEPGTSVIVNCLLTVAIDLDCDVSEDRTMSLDESTRLEGVLSLITQKLRTMIDAFDWEGIRSKRKAITTLLPYAVWRKRDGDCGLFNTILGAAQASHLWRFMWCHAEPIIATFLGGSHTSLKLAAILASPHLPWLEFIHGEKLTHLWGAAAVVVPYTDEVGQVVVDTLFQIVSDDTLRQHLPAGIWLWLGRLSSLPPMSWGRHSVNHTDTIKIIRKLRDIQLLKSYLLLVLSEWTYPDLRGTRTTFQEDFSGIGMWQHREDLLRHLDHVLGQLDLGADHFRQHNININEYLIRRTKEQYEELKAVLLEVDVKAVGVLTQCHSTFACALPLQCP